MAQSMLDLLAILLPNTPINNLEDLLQRLPLLTPVHFAKGDNIYYKGQAASQLFILQSGLVRVFDYEQDNEVNLRFLCDGSVVMPFYDVAIYWQQINTAIQPAISNRPSCFTHPLPACIARDTAQCLTACTGFMLSLAAIEELGDWAMSLKLELALRHYKSMENRLRMLQLKSAKQRYQSFVATMPDQIVHHIPSLQIASYLGITPETLSRIRHHPLLDG
ncbi:MAG: Crp/Fnr family transcriptional regulator [Psychrobacter sp.]|nr:Crp/Fnr family transcriptional regulator [Psychrobacter sp.]